MACTHRSARIIKVLENIVKADGVEMLILCHCFRKGSVDDLKSPCSGCCNKFLVRLKSNDTETNRPGFFEKPPVTAADIQKGTPSLVA